MRLRSTANLLIFFAACALIVNLVLSLFKQIISQKKTNLYLDQRKVELEKLAEENKRLKERLEETEKPDFFSSEAGRLFGLTEDGLLPRKTIKKEDPEAEINQVTVPNWQKWLRLFNF